MLQFICDMPNPQNAEVIVVGGGLAGLSAAVYLGRAKRVTLVIDSGRSMARWEPDVQNYLGFPKGISGKELLRRAKEQARRYGARFVRDEIKLARRRRGKFLLRGENGNYVCRRLLLATGIFHVPPDIPEVKPCLGRSMFFCKDCDGYRVQHRAIAIYGWRNETVEYALGMLMYSACVVIVTDGRKPRWSRRHEGWIREYEIPVYRRAIEHVQHARGQIRSLVFQGGDQISVQGLFTTRGDIYFNKLAQGLGARVDRAGEIVTDVNMRTTVRGLYSAGCVTPANCQMIIAAGQGASAAQAINRDLFQESLATHSLRRVRIRQIRKRRTRPVMKRNGQQWVLYKAKAAVRAAALPVAG
jgi:thioredoxin reductase (NADPH)